MRNFDPISSIKIQTKSGNTIDILSYEPDDFENYLIYNYGCSFVSFG
jgi:hypothetical protein